VGNYEKALKNYQEALTLDSNFPEALNNLALFYLKQNINIDAALAFAQKSIQIEEKPAFFDTVGQIYEKKGLLSKALEFYDISLSLHPQKASTILKAARILLEMKRYDSSMKYLERLVNSDYKGIDLFLMRISLLKKTGKFTEAHIQVSEIINSYNKSEYDIKHEKALKEEIQSYFRTTVWTAALTYYRIIYSEKQELPDALTLKSLTRIFYDKEIPYSDNDGNSFFINRNGIVESKKFGINPDIFEFINFFAIRGREVIEQICLKNQEIITIALYEYIMLHDSSLENINIGNLNIDSDIIKCPAGGLYYLKKGKVVCEKHGQLY
ncbi:MAG: tetratricopeptide repeat protein, partial [Candidatus Muirbacterium halophilum]|nr:tetratricopeptide repeat protein [Candidatus Muirbacterium halophilum]